MTSHISLPTYYFGHVISVLKQSGIGVEKWLASQRLDLDKLLQADARVSVEQFDGLIKSVIETRGFEDLGLSVGKRLEIAHHGDFGLAILNSATLRQVLDFHVRFIGIRLPLVKLDYHIEDTQVVMHLSDEHWQGGLHRALIEAVMVAIVNMLHAVKFQDGQQLLIDVVTFDYSEPEYAKKYEYIKVNELLFGLPVCSLRFAKRYVDKPLANADDFSFQRAVLNCEKELSCYQQHTLNVVEKVLKLLKQDEGVLLGLNEVANLLNLSKRSLHRALEREGTSFKKLLQQVRADRAAMLFHQGKTVTEVAELLGYSDCANFRRAFKTWFGLAPKEWVAKNGITNGTT